MIRKEAHGCAVLEGDSVPPMFPPMFPYVPRLPLLQISETHRGGMEANRLSMVHLTGTLIFLSAKEFLTLILY